MPHTDDVIADYPLRESLDFIIRERRAVRSFSHEPVPDEVIEHCLELAMLAPNSCNLQPWEFIVIRQPETLKALHSICLHQKAAKAPVIIAVLARPDAWKTACPAIIRQWPQHPMPDPLKRFYSAVAPFQYNQGRFGIRGLLKRTFTWLSGLSKPVMRTPSSKADMNVWAVKSTALAAENLMLALQSHRYCSCPLEGFDEKRLKKLLNIAPGRIPVMLIAAGKPGERPIYNPRMRFDPADAVRWL